MSKSDDARTGDIFISQLAGALAQQDPEVRERLERELRAGNYEIGATDDKKIIVKIAGSVVLEAQLFVEPPDVKLD